MKEQLKNRIAFILKYLTGIALLIWILARVDRAQMLDTVLSISLPTFSLLLLIAFINITIQFYRWKYLVENHSNHYVKKDLLPSFFAGFAFRLIIPGGHAEITKIFLLPGKKRGKVVAFGIEKFFQTYIKLVLVLMALALQFSAYRFLWIFAGLGVVAYFFIPLIFRLKVLKQFQEKEINYNRIFLKTLIYSLTIFLFLILQYYILLNESHTIGFYETTLTSIFIWGSGLIPISVSGLGVRENLAAFFLARYQIPPFAAVGTSLLVFFINAIIPALIGSIFIIRRRADLKDAKGTFKSVTQSIYNSGRDRLNGKRRIERPPDITPGPASPAQDSN